MSRALSGWLAGCSVVPATLYVVGLVLLAMGPGVGVIGLFGGALALLVFALLVFVLTCLLTVIPAAFVVWFSERFETRSLLFFGCAGAAIGAATQTLLFGTFASFSLLFVLAGYLAGLAYWQFAGKHGSAPSNEIDVAHSKRAVQI